MNERTNDSLLRLQTIKRLVALGAGEVVETALTRTDRWVDGSGFPFIWRATWGLVKMQVPVNSAILFLGIVHTLNAHRYTKRQGTRALPAALFRVKKWKQPK